MFVCPCYCYNFHLIGKYGIHLEKIGKYIWHHTQTLVLSTNMRAQLFGDASSSQFAKDLLTIGDGKVPLDQNGELPISRICTIVNSEIELMNRVYPNIPEHYQQPNQGQNLGNYQELNHYQKWLCDRAILAPKNDTVNSVNFELLKRIPGICHTYNSIDTVTNESEAVEYPI